MIIMVAEKNYIMVLIVIIRIIIRIVIIIIVSPIGQGERKSVCCYCYH